MTEDEQGGKAYLEETERAKMERIGRYMAQVLPPNTWLLLYLDEDGRGPLKSVSTLPVEVQADMARAAANSFDNSTQQEMLKVTLTESKPEPKIEPFNEWGVMPQRGMVGAFAPPNFPMSPDRALQLAAWLVIAVGLEADEFAWERFRKVYSACLLGG